MDNHFPLDFFIFVSNLLSFHLQYKQQGTSFFNSIGELLFVTLMHDSYTVVRGLDTFAYAKEFKTMMRS